ncbi:MAG: hypothetical protein K2Q23_00430 [Bryobacteraceae bacterium]|nr:hypothetical protein [Bryobacteraceae bacterium]
MRLWTAALWMFAFGMAWAQTAAPGAERFLSSRVELSERLAAWKKEIEAAGRLVLAPVRIYVVDGAYILPQDTPYREVLFEFFRDTSFRNQFVRAHAFNINWESALEPGKRVSFVLLNMQRMPEFSGQEEDLLSHEFGHVWLHARGLRAPAYVPGTLACEAVHSGDMVQHVAIRREQDERGFRFRAGWIEDLKKALRQTEGQERATRPTPDPCQRLQRLALVVDLEMGLTNEEWAERQRLVEWLGEGDEKLRRVSKELLRVFRSVELEERLGYYAALGASRAASQILLEPE